MSHSTPSPHVPKGPVLNRILREAADYNGSGQKFLAVFDLDSTLFDLTLRVSRIIDDFAVDPVNQSRFPKECELVRSIKIERKDWGIGEGIERLGLKEADHKEFYAEIHKAWALGFFSNDYLHCDQPLPGAVGFVNELRKLNAHIMYLTGRDIPRMLHGTENSLRLCGFPVEDETAELILKPIAELDDAEFKVEVLKEAEKKYQRIWLFENEPVNLNLVARECPEIGLVFIDSNHSGREQVAETLDRIDHFEVSADDF